MFNIRIAVLLFSTLLMMTAFASDDAGAPSKGAENLPGAAGTFEFKPKDWVSGETTWWKDTDGVAPGVAGCHIGTDVQGVPNGRMFGEACLSSGLLVESNPGADELHSHNDDTGHPDTFDCNAWCIGQGNIAGVCVAATAPPCKQSARCECVAESDTSAY